MMKADVLDNFDSIKVAVRYKVNGVETERYPYDADAVVEPIYEEFKGWRRSISACRSAKELPQELLNYIAYIAEQTGVPVKMVSVGADRIESVKL
jgi:adenylosuccinate synthase